MFLKDQKEHEMILEKEYEPQYREADEDGMIGARGYLNYFQDMAGEFMYRLDKGNETLRKKYKTFWMYTKYKMHIEKKADFQKRLHMETWVKKSRHTAVLNQGFKVSRDGQIYAEGVLESCFFNIEKQRPVIPASVGFPMEVSEERESGIQSFTRLRNKGKDMKYCYSYIVRYTDLDGNHHMTNLHYVNLILDACDSRFYKEHRITDFEIHYLNQSYEKEELDIYKKVEDHKIYVTIILKDGRTAAQGIITVENI